MDRRTFFIFPSHCAGILVAVLLVREFGFQVTLQISEAAEPVYGILAVLQEDGISTG